MSQAPLSGDEIRGYLAEVAEELGADGPTRTVILVGGALLALRGFRDATHDVDTTRVLDAEIAEAVAAVAERHDLAPAWLNANAAPFLPATFDESECEMLFEASRLRVLGAPLDQIFVMKLYAGRAQDREDMISIWSHTGFTRAEAAAAVFWAAYPHSPADEFLVDFITEIAQEASPN